MSIMAIISAGGWDVQSSIHLWGTTSDRERCNYKAKCAAQIMLIFSNSVCWLFELQPNLVHIKHLVTGALYWTPHISLIQFPSGSFSKKYEYCQLLSLKCLRCTRDSIRLSFVNVVLNGRDIFIVLLAWRPRLGLEETVDDALYDQGMIFKSCPLVLFKCSWCRKGL